MKYYRYQKRILNFQLGKLKEEGATMVSKMTALGKDIQERDSKLKVVSKSNTFSIFIDVEANIFC